MDFLVELIELIADLPAKHFMELMLCLLVIVFGPLIAFYAWLFRSPRKKEEARPLTPEPTVTVTVEAVPAHSPQMIKCHKCDGHYVERRGPYGVFAGCSNYPSCDSTMKLREFIKRIIKSQGVKIYAWNKECGSCGKTTKVYSYYLNINYYTFLPMLDQCTMIGLGDIPDLDAYIANRFPSITFQYSRTSKCSYFANTCDHCHRLQGYNYVVTDPHEIWDDIMSPDCHKRMEKYLLTVLFIEDDAIIEKIASHIAREYAV